MFRLFRSSAFRLTLIYMVTFGASVTALLIFVYNAIISDMQEDLKHSIGIQMADLSRKLTVSGPAETGASIQHMLEKDEEKTLVLMLIDHNWKVIAGNLEMWPGGKTNVSTWITFPIGKAQASSLTPRAIAMNATLPGGYILLVGRKMADIEHVHEIIVEVLYICFGIMFVLAAVGGMLISYTIHRRIEAVNQAFRRVAAGALLTRVRVTGTGDEFDHLAVHLNQTLNRICELIDGVRDISYNVAHDLRTPLNRLRHRLESLLASSMTKDQTEQVRLSIAEIDALVATFNAILRIAQAELGAGVEQFGDFNLSEVVADVVDLYRPVAEEKSQQVSVEIAPDATLHGDRHLITQAVANVLDNAIKYTPKGGHIAVTLAVAENTIELKLADDGPGIPEAFHSRVTEKFFRLEQSRSSPGNGLGLSLVSAAIKLHKGELSFMSNDPGLCVVMRLPRK
jgi:signal transduction histidine kinase